MTRRMLVVASPTLSPLSTDGPIPTDGLPEWWRCPLCGDRKRDAIGPGGWCNDCLPLMTHATRDRYNQRVPDGLFPATVAVWQEVATCGACGSRFPWPPQRLGPTCELHASGHCEPWDDPVGAVVATVEVTGPGHHADDCAHDAPGRIHGFPQGRAREVERRYCHPDSLPGDCWHTPTGEVTRLDVPIPMERPTAKAEGHFGYIDRPASWWWADIDLEVPA